MGQHAIDGARIAARHFSHDIDEKESFGRQEFLVPGSHAVALHPLEEILGGDHVSLC